MQPLCERRGELDTAEKHYRHASEEQPTLVQAHKNLGDLAYRRGLHEEALEHFKRAVELAPQGGDVDLDHRAEDEHRTLRIREAKTHSDSIVAWAHDIDGRDAAEALKGSRIFVPRSSFPTAGDDEYYWVDLIGLDVVNRESVALGRVTDLLSTGPQTVLVLESDAGY